ncbi:hypothetical protein BDM02DRAFT_3182877 [Thelephora ganbajun]|uniref:Uncharacterized protein n=1 Tax=Thelephora ganbajun TaxID=370292 RepID=A0ACB6ZUX3_THEGA|nr:hypothetical protein BDM02DRAFT_3182877 [Thelephora ganbajun]
MNKFMAISITLDQVLPQDLLEETTVDLISNIPREEIVYFRAHDKHTAMGDISAQFPHLKTLHLVGVPLSAAFPKPTLDNHGKILPSLQHITLDWVVVHNNDWNLLKNFLSSRAFSGSEVDTLEIIGSYDMHPRIFRSIEGKVRKFRAPRASSY